MSGQYPPSGFPGGQQPNQPGQPGRPVGQPSGPPPTGPTMRPGAGWGAGGPTQPPGGGMPPGGMPPGGMPPGGMPPGGMPFGQPPKKGKGKLIGIIASGVALLLIVVTLTSLFFTGKLGFGPLTGDQKQIAKEIGSNVNGPEWTSDDDLQCGAESLLKDQRGAVADADVVKAKGDGWEYTGEWDEDQATIFYEGVLDCAGDDWAKQVGKVWSLDDTDCLSKIDKPTMAAYFAGDTLFGSEEDADETSEEDSEEDTDEDSDEESDAGTSEEGEKLKEGAVKDLDKCYLEDAPQPEAEVKSAYRGVTVEFEEVDVEGGDFALEVSEDSDDWKAVEGTSYLAETSEGGEEACVNARVAATYPWGSVSESEEEEFCGKAKPKELFWKALKSCDPTGYAGGCVAYSLRYAGWEASSTIEVTYTYDGSTDCRLQNGCTVSRGVPITGRGFVQQITFPKNLDATFVAQADGIEAPLPKT